MQQSSFYPGVGVDQQDRSIIVFNMLPVSVSSRLPALQALRRSASLSILASSRLRRRQSDPESEGVVAAATSDENRVVELATTVSEPVTQPTPAPTPPPRPPPSTERTAKYRRLRTENIESNADVASTSSASHQNVPPADSGVKWTYAAQGLSMGHAAIQQNNKDPGFARKAYVDGAAYFLRALPADLDDHETSVIMRSLPESCLAQGEAQAPGVLPADRRLLGWRQQQQQQQAGNGGPSSYLRYCVRSVVSSLVQLLYALWTCAVLVARFGVQYERQYNVSQHVFAQGLAFATAVGRHSVVIGSKVCAVSDGRVGKVLSGLAAWAVESVTGGIQDGIGQGLQSIEHKRQ
ncbi:hypothetical protein F4778DRAFT_364766 [Xylariomycetidae sp. FL2044]|nr:hypothetical protein F4778DRAFT_364766 [Xylariomycetidae sp. FL2044]